MILMTPNLSTFKLIRAFANLRQSIQYSDHVHTCQILGIFPPYWYGDIENVEVRCEMIEIQCWSGRELKQ